MMFLLHEIGHWLSLLHTFAFECGSRPQVFEGMAISDGDGVQDTPAQAYATWENDDGRPTCWLDSKLDTCNETAGSGIDPGLDAVTNCELHTSGGRPHSHVSRFLTSPCLSKRHELH